LVVKKVVKKVVKNLENVVDKNGFKETKIGKIPREWTIIELSKTLEIIRNGLVSIQNKAEDGIPVTRIETISKGKIDLKSVGYIKNIDEATIKKYRLELNDLLFSHIGKTAIYNGFPKILLHGMNLLLLRANKRVISPKYLFYLLNFNKSQGMFRSMGKKAVNQASINQIELGKINLLIPPLSEQEKIAEILSTIDYSIEEIDESITKTEALKKGLMLELFTKGIGHKEFKETEIGKIPKEWEVNKIENLLCLEYGSGLTDKERRGSEYPVYGSNGIIGYNSEYLVDGPGIVVGRKGTIGAIKWSKVNFWPIDTTYYVKLKELKINLMWLFYKLSTLNLSKLNMATGTPGLNRDIVYKLQISLPLFTEQGEIAEILSAADERIQLLKDKKNKLDRIKKGLMNVLLTGRKRVQI